MLPIPADAVQIYSLLGRVLSVLLFHRRPPGGPINQLVVAESVHGPTAHREHVEGGVGRAGLELGGILKTPQTVDAEIVVLGGRDPVVVHVGAECVAASFLGRTSFEGEHEHVARLEIVEMSLEPGLGGNNLDHLEEFWREYNKVIMQYE